jgi:hypothetical protein
VPKDPSLSASEITCILDFFDGCSESRSCALTPKAHYGNGLHGIIDLKSITIAKEHELIKDRPIASIKELFRDEAIVRRVVQHQLACCKILQSIGSDAIYAASRLFESNNDNVYLMNGRNDSISKHQVSVFEIL